MEDIKQSAFQFPDDHVVFVLDGMDNSKSYTPRTLENAKSTAGMKKLPTKIMGTIIHSGNYPGNRSINLFLNHDQYEQASNYVVSVIYKLITFKLRDHGRLPSHLHIFCDNCWSKWL